MNYLHEIVKVRPGKMEEWLDVVERRYLTLASRYRNRLVGFWETAHSQDWFPETVAVWEVDHYTDIVRRSTPAYQSTRLSAIGTETSSNGSRPARALSVSNLN